LCCEKNVGLGIVNVAVGVGVHRLELQERGALGEADAVVHLQGSVFHDDPKLALDVIDGGLVGLGKRKHDGQQAKGKGKQFHGLAPPC